MSHSHCLTEVFKVIEVKRYPNCSMVWVRTSVTGTNNRFFVRDSNIWEVGNTIRRTIQRVPYKIEQPNTVYTEDCFGIYRMQDELI